MTISGTSFETCNYSDFPRSFPRCDNQLKFPAINILMEIRCGTRLDKCGDGPCRRTKEGGILKANIYIESDESHISNGKLSYDCGIVSA